MPPPDTRGAARPAASPVAPLLTAVVRSAASGGPLQVTLHRIVTEAVGHVDASYGALGILSRDGQRLENWVVVGMDDEDSTRIGRLPSGHGVLGLLVAAPEAIRLDDLRSHPASTGFPTGHPPMRSFLGIPVRVGDAVFGNLYLTEKRTGSPFTAADVEVAEALAAVAGLAIENARLAERAERGRRWGRAATEMVTALLSGADPDGVLHTVATHVLALAGADLAGVLAPCGDDDDALTVAAAVGLGAADLEGVRLPLSGTYLGATRRAGAPRRIDDIGALPVVGRRAAVTTELSAGYGPAVLTPLGTGPGACLLAAMRVSGREPFDPDDLDLLAAYAGQVAPALELARTQRRQQQLSVQTDRDRIARDLHDHVVQRIFATALSLDRLSRLLEPQHEEAAARLARSVDELDETMAEIRSAIFELHQQNGPEQANPRHQLADVVHRVTEGQGLQCDVRFRGRIEQLPGELLPDLLAVLRELVTNVVRHARAHRVTITVTVDHGVAILVTDDGVGLPEVTSRSGLANLADRAERRGGRLTATSPGIGAEIHWEVPLPD